MIFVQPRDSDDDVLVLLIRLSSEIRAPSKELHIPSRKRYRTGLIFRHAVLDPERQIRTGTRENVRRGGLLIVGLSRKPESIR